MRSPGTGVTITSAYAVKARTVWNAAVRQRTNGGVVVILTPAGAPLAEAELASVRDLAGLIHDSLGPILWGSVSKGSTRQPAQP